MAITQETRRKPKNVKGTKKQKLAVQIMAENGGNASRAMREAGYTDVTAATPKKLTESKGFKALCDMYGLTDSLIVESLVDDIRKKPQRRSPELALGADILGLRRNGGVTAVQVNIQSDQARYD